MEGILIVVVEVQPGQTLLRGLAAHAVHRRAEPERVRQHEGSVVMVVVSHKPVAHGSLRHGGLYGLVSAEGTHHGVESAIRAAYECYALVAALVATGVADEPFGSVVHVAGLVDVGFLALIGYEGAHVDKLPLAAVAAAHVLHHEDIALLGILFPGVPQPRGHALAVWRGRIRSTGVQHRRRCRGMERLVYGRVEAHTVAHGYHHLALGVVVLHPLAVYGGSRQLHARQEHGQEKKKGYNPVSHSNIS